MRETSGKKKKDRRVFNKREVNSAKGLAGGKAVDDNEGRGKEKTVEQKKKDGRRQSMQQKRGKRVSGDGLPGGTTVEVENRGERERDISKTVKQNEQNMTYGRRQSVQQM